jgi:hypothetical protein
MRIERHQDEIQADRGQRVGVIVKIQVSVGSESSRTQNAAAANSNRNGKTQIKDKSEMLGEGALPEEAKQSANMRGKTRK